MRERERVNNGRKEKESGGRILGRENERGKRTRERE